MAAFTANMPVAKLSADEKSDDKLQTIAEPLQINNDLFGLLVKSYSHTGGSKITEKMKRYVWGQLLGKRNEKLHVFDLKKTWDKLYLAARVCAAAKDQSAVIAISGKTFGRKPVRKFADAVSSRAFTERFVPGTFTNTNIKGSCEPEIIIVSDPVIDKQAIAEAAKVNCPVIAFCNTDADLSFVDIAIPFNNRSRFAIGVGFFLLSRLIKYIRNESSAASLADDLKEVELFFYRDATELESLLAEQKAENGIEMGDLNDACIDEEDFGNEQTAAHDDEAGWD